MRTGRQCRGLGWDHPRVGGEKLSCISLLGELLESPPQGGEKLRSREPAFVVRGSPPRGRGKVELVQLLVVGDRITPAWAGKRRCGSSASPRGWDHPRVGGEKVDG